MYCLCPQSLLYAIALLTTFYWVRQVGWSYNGHVITPARVLIRITCFTWDFFLPVFNLIKCWILQLLHYEFLSSLPEFHMWIILADWMIGCFLLETWITLSIPVVLLSKCSQTSVSEVLSFGKQPVNRAVHLDEERCSLWLVSGDIWTCLLTFAFEYFSAYKEFYLYCFHEHAHVNYWLMLYYMYKTFAF